MENNDNDLVAVGTAMLAYLTITFVMGLFITIVYRMVFGVWL